MKWPSLTVIASGIFLAYIGHSIWTIYGLFTPPVCQPRMRCMKPFHARLDSPPYELHVYTSQQKKIMSSTKLTPIFVWKAKDFKISETLEKTVNISVPLGVRKNGTLYLHVFATPKDESPIANSWTSHASGKITKLSLPKTETYNLMGSAGNSSEDSAEDMPDPNVPFTHWFTQVTVNIVDELLEFGYPNVPADIYHRLTFSPERDYLPILYFDELGCRLRDLQPVNISAKKMPLTIHYNPISIGKYRLWNSMLEAIRTLNTLGFSDKDTDEMKAIFSDTNFYFLMLTFVVAAFHLLFDFLAFKNDISYWKNRESMVGLSTRVVLWRCGSTIIIFFYLMDEETSMLVLVPAGIGALIEIWKVKKALKVKVTWTGIRPSFQLGDSSEKEKETQAFDSQAMKYLSYLLYPLCVGGAIYSLLYTPHKSWYSWCIKCAVNGVYAFGFLFMLPQLFVNYKLKSVAHLPWRAFMYKAFNTFIDDIFAFIITMPTAHRLACFRDDLVFLVYLYQRWLYPVDKKRVNEYGQSFDEDKRIESEVETKKTK